MPKTVQDFLGDGDGPACAGAPEENKGPLLIMTRQITANWRVSREGNLVVITVGNLPPIRLRWEAAASFGHAISTKAFEAKVQAGDMGKRNEIVRA